MNDKLLPKWRQDMEEQSIFRDGSSLGAMLRVHLREALDYIDQLEKEQRQLLARLDRYIVGSLHWPSAAGGR